MGKTKINGISEYSLNDQRLSLSFSSNKSKRKASTSPAATPSTSRHKRENHIQSNNELNALTVAPVPQLSDSASAFSSLFYAVPLGRRSHPFIEMHRINFYLLPTENQHLKKTGQHQKKFYPFGVPAQRHTELYCVSQENSRSLNATAPPSPLLFPSSIALVDFAQQGDQLKCSPPTMSLFYILEYLFRQTAYTHYTQCPLCSPITPTKFLSWFSVRTKKKVKQGSAVGTMSHLPYCVWFVPRTVRRPVIEIMTAQEIKEDVEWFLKMDEINRTHDTSSSEVSDMFIFETEFRSIVSNLKHEKNLKDINTGTLAAYFKSDKMFFDTSYSRVMVLRFFICSFLLHTSQRRRIFQDSIPSRYASSSRCEDHHGHSTSDVEVHPAIAACDTLGGIALLNALLIGVGDAFSFTK